MSMYEQEQWNSFAENQPVKLTYVDTEDGDWAGIYINDKLYDEGHSIPIRVMLEVIGKYKNFWGVSRMTLTVEQIEELGCGLPNNFYDITKVLE